jgi:hypothetical protein
VWFDLQGAFDQAAYSLDFFRRNIRWTPAPAYKGVDAGRRHDAQHSIEPAPDEQVIWEKREQKLLLTVFPPMDGSILRKKYPESLVRQGLGDHFLVLMANVKRVPPADTRASGEISDFLVPQHQTPPSVLENWFLRARPVIVTPKDTLGPLVVIAATALPSGGQDS